MRADIDRPYQPFNLVQGQAAKPVNGGNVVFETNNGRFQTYLSRSTI